jgi:hypothetical protein
LRALRLLACANIRTRYWPPACAFDRFGSIAASVSQMAVRRLDARQIIGESVRSRRLMPDNPSLKAG